MVEPSPREEFRRLLGDGVEVFDVQGNDVTLLSEYVIDILADSSPRKSPFAPRPPRYFASVRRVLEKTSRPRTACRAACPGPP